MQRPVGVTILAIIDGIQALLLTIMGTAVLFLGKLVVAEMQAEPELSELFEQPYRSTKHSYQQCCSV